MTMTKEEVVINFLTKRMKEVEVKNRLYPSENTQDCIDKAYGDGFIEGLRLAIEVVELLRK